jgi:hypothetical protein
MVNMTHRPNIHMRLRTLELRLRHGGFPFLSVATVLANARVFVDVVAAIGIEPMTFRL